MLKEEYVIFGVNRVAKDFEYIFRDRLKIKYFIDEYKTGMNTFCGYDVYGFDSLDHTYKIIICDFDKAEKQLLLENKGLVYGRDFFYEEDFFSCLGEHLIPKDKKLIVWGMGRYGKKFVSTNKDYKIEFCVDSNYFGEDYMGYHVYSPNEIDNWEDYFVIAAAGRNKEICAFLEEHGLSENEDFIRIQKLESMPSYLLRKTIFDKSCYDFECNTMLNHLEILAEGNTSCCCTTFLKIRMENVFEKGFDEAWNSIIHRILCLSSENRTYSFCDKTMCPFFIGKASDTEVSLNTAYKEMEDSPKTLVLGYDNTCNLKCETCRKDYKAVKGKEAEQLMECSKGITRQLLSNCNFLIAAGSGEVLLSKAYKAVYMDERCSNVPYIRLLTNGMLLTPERWETFRKGKTGKILLTVSIDAATAETYEKIRCGGDFKKLKENMEFASKLRKTGELAYFRINFVVQRKNYKEMIPFVEWGVELGVDEVFFTKILNWGTYSEEEFSEVSMMEADGITPKKELQEILNDSRMKLPVVDMGTIQYSHKEVTDNVIENYYMWELERKVPGLFKM